MFASSETLAELLMDTGSDATESKLHVDLITALAKRTQARPEELPRAWSLAGRLHQARGEHSEAADALGQAVDLGRARTHHPVELASDLLRYGASLLALRRATDAVAAYEEGAALLERSLGPTHPRCVEAKAGLAEARRQAGA
jgi:tetratricopeptide (TPR) repeat protein